MNSVKVRVRRKRRGAALVVSMIFLMIFAALATAMVSMSGTSLQLADNQHQANYALASAESGLEIMRYYLAGATISGSVAPQGRLQSIAGSLQSALTAAGASNISAIYDSAAGAINVAAVTLDSQGNRNFAATITYGGDFDTLQMDVTGNAQQFTRRIRTDYNFTNAPSGAFDFGVATKGPLQITGNARLLGLNNAGEANVYIQSDNSFQALDMTGNATIQGDVSIVNALASVSLTGNCQIGGESGQDAVDNHVLIGAPLVELPVAEPNTFEPYAANLVDSSTATNGNRTFENIRIAAGTNPTFSGNITINGVVYIESPNVVSFSGNTTLTGVVVAEGNLQSPNPSDSINFTGNLTSRCAGQLPAGAAFDGLRDKTDTFVLAPGFALNFSGNFNTINGAMAASGVSFTGNAGGVVTNSVINYSDNTMTLTGNANLRFDRSAGPINPAGFEAMQALEFQAASYAEMPL